MGAAVHDTLNQLSFLQQCELVWVHCKPISELLLRCMSDKGDAQAMFAILCSMVIVFAVTTSTTNFAESKRTKDSYLNIWQHRGYLEGKSATHCNLCSMNICQA